LDRSIVGIINLKTNKLSNINIIKLKTGYKYIIKNIGPLIIIGNSNLNPTLFIIVDNINYI
jgi:hypothetical protein